MKYKVGDKVKVNKRYIKKPNEYMYIELEDYLKWIKLDRPDKITEEVYTGEEAEKMLAELQKVDEEKIVSSQEVKEEIHIEDVEGIKIKIKDKN